MRTFQDQAGNSWEASVGERPGADYKGRFFLVFTPEGGSPSDAVSLEDVRWNTRETGERTLETMSDVELRRRLRSALGRSGTVTAAGS